MMEVAIFGGSFNPPTRAHEAVLRACLELPDFDEVWTMPSGDRLDKAYAVDDAHRLAMTSLMHHRINDPRLFLSRFELDLERPSKTIRTLGALTEKHPEVRPTFVIGADSYWDMGTPAWIGGEYLQKHLQMLIIPRANLPNPKADNVTVLDINSELRDISSTEVRRRITVGESISQLVDPWVSEYIIDNALYRSQVSARPV